MASADLLAPVLAYLLGCVSSAYYLVRWRTGRDVRQEGSGNAGATNAGRVLGPRAFLLVLVSDAAKGGLAVWMVARLTADPWLTALALPLSVAGHIWPIQLGLRGGEGFATALGALLVLDPLLLTTVAGLALAAYALTRSRAIAGAGALLAAPLLALLLGREMPELLALGLVVGLILWSFRRHLRRLLRGSEHG